MTWFIAYGIGAVLLLVIMNVGLIWKGKTASRPKTLDQKVRGEAVRLKPSSEPQAERPELQRRPILADAPVESLVETSDEAVDESSSRPPLTESVSGNTSADVRPVRVMTVFLLGAFVTILNQTLMNVALPHMMNEFNVSADTIQWLITGYMLINGVLVPISAYLVQTFSSRDLFLFAMGSFGVGSLISALAPSFALLLTGRLVQAIGAGIIMPLMMNVFLAIFPPQSRGKAMGVMGLTMIFAPAVGPTLSGWIVENYSWRILFYISLPFALISVILAIFWLKNVLALTRPKLDVLGTFLSVIGFGALLYGLSRAGSLGWGSGEVRGTIAVGLVALIWFVLHSLRVPNPILEMRVFRYNIFTMTSLVSALVTMAMFSAMVILPIYLQNIRGFSPIQAGLLLLPGALVMGVMSPIAGALFDRIGARPLAIIGLLITVYTTWEFTRLSDGTSYGSIMLLYTIRMFGMSLMMMTVMTEGLNQLPRALNPHGTAMANTVRQVAGSLGTALLVTVMTNRTTVHVDQMIASVSTTDPLVMEQFNKLTHSISLSAGLPESLAQPVAQTLLWGTVQKEAVIAGINDAFIWATVIAAAALFFSFFIRRARPESTQPGEAPKQPQQEQYAKNDVPSVQGSTFTPSKI